MLSERALKFGGDYGLKTMKDGGLLYSFAPGHGRLYMGLNPSGNYVMVFGVAEAEVHGFKHTPIDEPIFPVFGIEVPTPRMAEAIGKGFMEAAQIMRQRNEADRG